MHGQLMLCMKQAMSFHSTSLSALFDSLTQDRFLTDNAVQTRGTSLCILLENRVVTMDK